LKGKQTKYPDTKQNNIDNRLCKWYSIIITKQISQEEPETELQEPEKGLDKEVDRMVLNPPENHPQYERGIA
jgi:hypothetical protein